MKTAFQLLCRAGLLGVGLMFVSLPCAGQITVKVDSTRNWLGWMNVFDTNNAYLYGQAWGAADLRAAFVPNVASA
jgi:hypothetical protein